MKTFISPVIYCGIKDPEFEMTPEQTVELIIRLTHLKKKITWNKVIGSTSLNKAVRGLIIQAESGPEEFCVQSYGNGFCIGQNENQCYEDRTGLYDWLLSIVEPHLNEYNTKTFAEQQEYRIPSIDLTKDYSK